MTGMGKVFKTVEPTKPQYKIFDTIVSWPVIRLLKPLYEWKRSFWIYCVLGFMSVVADFITSAIFKQFISSATIVTAIAFAVSTFASFVMFRYLYFDRTNNSFLNELFKFIPTRLFTFFFGEIVMFLFVDTWNFNFWLIKVVLIPVTAVLNYITSKIFVFKDKKS